MSTDTLCRKIERQEQRRAFPKQTYSGRHLSCSRSDRMQTFQMRAGGIIQCRFCSARTCAIPTARGSKVIDNDFVVHQVRGGKGHGEPAIHSDSALTHAMWQEALERMDEHVATMGPTERKVWRYCRPYLKNEEPPDIEAIARQTGMSVQKVGAIWQALSRQLEIFFCG